MENKINHLSSLSSEDIIKELCSKENSKFVNELSKLKKINKEMNKQLIEIFQKIMKKEIVLSLIFYLIQKFQKC